MNKSETINETYKHKSNVSKYIGFVIKELIERANTHDDSKISSFEADGFAKYTEILKDLTYGSEEYKETLKNMKPFLDHHYKHNRHHPEHFENGIKGMTLVDVVEMLCDWKAASLRHSDGNIHESIELNQKRFGYSDELKAIFLNTASLFREAIE
ncbi:MAG: DUF5662 family protein [Bacteroidales bacterium]|nr:DUF5662 family protein [Bacteroidales bacterium]